MVRLHFAIASLSLVSAYDEEYHHTQLLQTKVAVDESASTNRGQLKLKEVGLKWKHAFLKKGKKAKQPSYATGGSSEGSYGSYADTAGSKYSLCFNIEGQTHMTLFGDKEDPNEPICP